MYVLFCIAFCFLGIISATGIIVAAIPKKDAWNLCMYLTTLTVIIAVGGYALFIGENTLEINADDDPLFVALGIFSIFLYALQVTNGFIRFRKRFFYQKRQETR